MGCKLECLAAILPPRGRTCLRIEWRARKARFLIIIKMVTIILILIIANSYIVLTIFKLYSRSRSPPNNPRNWILLLLPFHR